jgi:hypothetical protein
LELLGEYIGSTTSVEPDEDVLSVESAGAVESVARLAPDDEVESVVLVEVLSVVVPVPVESVCAGA